MTTRRCAILTWSIALVAGLSTAHAQMEDPEELAKQIAARQQAAAAAAAVFFDAERSDQERLAAIEPYATLADVDQLSRAVEIARDATESGEIRAAALRRADPMIAKDPELISEILDWLEDPATPPALRRAALATAEELNFTTFGMLEVREDLISTFRALTGDQEIGYRRAAFGVLAPLGDNVAQQMLIAGARQKGDDPLPPEESVRLLGLAVHGDFMPALHEVMKDPPNEATRVEAIRLLGQYAAAREDLAKVLQDPAEELAARMAAAETLHANDPENFESYVMPVIRQPDAPEELVTFGIVSELYRRKANVRRPRPQQEPNGPQALAAPAGFEEMVRKLAAESASPAVRETARQFLVELEMMDPHEPEGE